MQCFQLYFGITEINSSNQWNAIGYNLNQAVIAGLNADGNQNEQPLLSPGMLPVTGLTGVVLYPCGESYTNVFLFTSGFLPPRLYCLGFNLNPVTFCLTVNLLWTAPLTNNLSLSNSTVTFIGQSGRKNPVGYVLMTQSSPGSPYTFSNAFYPGGTEAVCASSAYGSALYPYNGGSANGVWWVSTIGVGPYTQIGTYPYTQVLTAGQYNTTYDNGVYASNLNFPLASVDNIQVNIGYIGGFFNTLS